MGDVPELGAVAAIKRLACIVRGATKRSTELATKSVTKSIWARSNTNLVKTAHAGFQPWEHTQKYRIALKGRQIWNWHNHNIISTKPAPKTNPLSRPFRARRFDGTYTPGLKTGLKPWAEFSCPFGTSLVCISHRARNLLFGLFCSFLNRISYRAAS